MMTDEQQRRWAKIESMPIGPADGAITQFEDKLIVQTGWTRTFARLAIAEYRRYLLLAATAGHPVSPSPAVDHVWHLHLLYTRDYWDRWSTPEVLGFRLHHEPAVGTGEDRAKLGNWYARTLASYASLFDAPPPTDVWPTTPAATHVAQVDVTRCVIVPRGVWTAMLAGGIGLALLAGTCLVWLGMRSAQ